MKTKNLFFLFSLCLVLCFSACSNESDLTSNVPSKQESNLLEFEYKGVKYSSTYFYDVDSILILHDQSVKELLDKLNELPTLCTAICSDGSIYLLDSDAELMTIERASNNMDTATRSTCFGGSSMLFEHPYGEGRNLTVGIGRTEEIPDLAHVANNFDNIISSVRISSNCNRAVAVGIFEHPNYKGKSHAFIADPWKSWQYEDLAYLTMVEGFLGIGKKSWDNKASSVRIHYW